MRFVRGYDDMSKARPPGSVKWRDDEVLRRAKAELEEHRRLHAAALVAQDTHAAQREVEEIERRFATLGINFYSELEP